MMDKDVLKDIGDALGPIPSGIFVLTACFEDRRMGMIASWGAAGFV